MTNRDVFFALALTTCIAVPLTIVANQEVKADTSALECDQIPEQHEQAIKEPDQCPVDNAEIYY